MKNVCFPFDKFYERYGNPVTDGIADTDLFQNKPEMIAVLNHKRRRLLRWHNKFSKELGTRKRKKKFRQHLYCRP